MYRARWWSCWKHQFLSYSPRRWSHKLPYRMQHLDCIFRHAHNPSLYLSFTWNCIKISHEGESNPEPHLFRLRHWKLIMISYWIRFFFSSQAHQKSFRLRREKVDQKRLNYMVVFMNTMSWKCQQSIIHVMENNLIFYKQIQLTFNIRECIQNTLFNHC